ncbi:2-nitropropane dioxygenase [Xylaria nigripes]|nr:2-nitropropane dioxygenase [Xylaria nigripes]
MAPNGPITTPLTKLFGISHPIVLGSMARTSGGPLAAAVSNAGGLGVIGGFLYTSDHLRSIIAEMKAKFKSPDLSFGLFVCAIGVPPKAIIDRLHAAGILVMNMVGHPKHAVKALDLGFDLICAQGGEGGGHTGDVANSVLIPAVVDVVRKYKPPMLKGSTALVVAAGGIGNGRALAASLMQGAVGVWVGTRFVASEEANCAEAHKCSVVELSILHECDFSGTERTLVLSGRLLRMRPNEYIAKWHAQPDKIKELCDKGIVPVEYDLDKGNEVDPPHLMGQVAGLIQKIQPAKEIIDEMVAKATAMPELGNSYITSSSKL